MSEPAIREISLQPNPDPERRRYARVIAMVSELHKAGYQHIRLFPSLSPNGSFWRADITFAENTDAKGLPINSDLVARYSTGQGSEFFGWSDATNMNARQMAAAFVQRFPEIAREGQGRDWAYAGWLLDILGQAEAGSPVILWTDGDLLSEEHLSTWTPPPAPKPSNPLKVLHQYIPSDALTLSMLPSSHARWEDLEPFCTSFDGYDGGRRSIDACAEIKARVLNGGLTEASMDELRITLFIVQRKISWNELMPVQAAEVDEIRPVIEEIRRRLAANDVDRNPTTLAEPRGISWFAPSRLDPISVYQAELVSSSILELNDVAPWAFDLDHIQDIDLKDFQKIFELAEYLRFLDACYACGFVTRDTSPDFPIAEANARPEQYLGDCDLAGLRHYLHTLCRGERWADRYSSPVLEALCSGALKLVGTRLKNDERLRGD